MTENRVVPNPEFERLPNQNSGKWLVNLRAYLIRLLAGQSAVVINVRITAQGTEIEAQHADGAVIMDCHLVAPAKLIFPDTVLPDV